MRQRLRWAFTAIMLSAAFAFSSVFDGSVSTHGWMKSALAAPDYSGAPAPGDMPAPSLVPPLPVAMAVKSRGRVRTGPVVSTTVIVKEPVSLFEPTQETVVVPNGKSEPEGGEQVTTSSGLPSSSTPVGSM